MIYSSTLSVDLDEIILRADFIGKP